MYYNFIVNFTLVNTTDDPEIIKSQLVAIKSECHTINQENSLLFNNIKQLNIQDKTPFVTRYNTIQKETEEQIKLDTIRQNSEAKHAELETEQNSIQAKLDEIDTKLIKKKEQIKVIVKIVCEIIKKIGEAIQSEISKKVLTLEETNDSTTEETKEELESIKAENTDLSNQIVDNVQKIDSTIEQNINDVTENEVEEINTEASLENDLKAVKESCSNILIAQEDVLDDIADNINKMKEVNNKLNTTLNNDELKAKIESLLNKLLNYINTLKTDISITPDEVETTEGQIKAFIDAIKNELEPESSTFNVSRQIKTEDFVNAISLIIKKIISNVIKNSFLGLTIQKRLLTIGVNAAKTKVAANKVACTASYTLQHNKVKKLQDTISNLNTTILEKNPKLNSVSNFDKICNDVAVYQRNCDEIKALNATISDLESRLLKLGISPYAFDLPVADQIQTIFSY